jgi:hypothetical protein
MLYPLSYERTVSSQFPGQHLIAAPSASRRTEHVEPDSAKSEAAWKRGCDMATSSEPSRVCEGAEQRHGETVALAGSLGAARVTC